MKKILILFLLFSLFLPTQVSASVCGNSHLAYQKEKVMPLSVSHRQRLGKLIQKKTTEVPKGFWWTMLGIYLLFGMIIYLLGWILIQWSMWVLIGIVAFPFALLLLLSLLLLL